MSSYMRFLTVAGALLVATLTVYFLIVGRSLLIPLAVSIIVWYLINALATLVGRFKVGTWSPPRWLGLTVSLVTIVIFIAVFVEITSGTLGSALEAAPRYQANFTRIADQVAGLFGLKPLSELGTLASSLLKQINIGSLVRNVANVVTSIAGNVGVIVIYVAFLLFEQRYFERKLAALFPDPARRDRIRAVLGRIAREMQTYLWIKTLLAVVTGIVTWLLLWWVGLDFAGFWGFLTFLLYYVPTIGSIVALALPILLALIQFPTLWPALFILVVVGGIQTIIANVIEPRMMGRSLNLSPFVIILSLFVWGAIWGVTGMLLCVPLTMMMLIVFAEFPVTRPIAIVLSADGKIR
jgi:AI-2 transport protein TqsA